MIEWKKELIRDYIASIKYNHKTNNKKIDELIRTKKWFTFTVFFSLSMIVKIVFGNILDGINLQLFYFCF